MKENILAQLNESSTLKQRIAESCADDIEHIAQLLISCFQNNGSVYFCGNGGSFTDAHHIVGELVGRYGYDRAGLPAFVLGAGVAAMTAIGNDYGYDQVFSREAQAACKKGDVLVGLSTSGNSQNVVLAIEAAKQNGATTIGWCGEKQGKLDDLCDLVLHIPSPHTPRIQEGHITVGHIVCDLVEKALFPKTQE